MLFNSYAFIFGFLPCALFIFYSLGKFNQNIASFALCLLSLFFYAWWNPHYLILLVASIIFNFSIGKALRHQQSLTGFRAKRLLCFGITCNLMLLGYFKYANFFLASLQHEINLDWHLDTIILPLGISFFTFTQIAFLVDLYRGEFKTLTFNHYSLFVTYFPHLIAGPVIHHADIMPQFAKAETYRCNWHNCSVGLTLFTLGLFKKVILADSIAPFANTTFLAAANGEPLSFLAAWGGALAYTFQLYFDFSGYSDMAIGLSRLFGVTLPCNFNSPYKAVNIIEFWRRWHMTLSHFLRDYLYIPLGGNRKGTYRRQLNIFLTMLLGGLWHGAGWTFIVWGGLHGLFLVINHVWQQLFQPTSASLSKNRIGRGLGRCITFLMVVIAWVFFRVETLDAAQRMLTAMSGIQGINFSGQVNYSQVLLTFSLWAIVWFMPNTQQIMTDFSPTLEKSASKSGINWQPNLQSLVTVTMLLLYALTEIGQKSDFLYFQF